LTHAIAAQTANVARQHVRSRGRFPMGQTLPIS